MEMETTEERIIQAAVLEFSHYGLDGARIDRIAQKAKINKAMIYYHYKGKKDLYESILAKTADGIHSHLEKTLHEGARDTDDPLEQLTLLFRAYLQYMTSLDVNLVRVLMREIITDAHYFKKVILPNYLMPIRRRIEVIFDAGKRSGRIRDTNSFYTIIQVVGSILFYNIIRISLQETDFAKPLLEDDGARQFADHLLKIVKSGIENKGGENG